MAKRLIGTATTDSNGVATITYTGVGAGLLNIQAETSDETLTSDTIQVYDCLMMDDGSSTYANTFGSETGAFTRSEGGATVYWDNSSSSSAKQFGLTNYITGNNGGEIAIDMDLLECSYAQIQTGRYLTGASTQYENVPIEDNTGKLHIEILSDRTVFYLDDTILREQTQGETNLEKFSVFFRVGGGQILSLKYKNLIAYVI